MRSYTLNNLYEHARNIRHYIIAMTTRANSGHPGGSLSSADIITYVYFNLLNIRALRDQDPNRDRFILSAGHLCPAVYAALAEANLISQEQILTLRQFGSPLQGHPDRLMMPYLETSSGSLGQGLSIALGFALSLPKKSNVFCLTSDAEHQEGSTWEAIMAAAHFKTSNLISIVDRNYLQIDGSTENVMALNSLKDKYRSFGWNVIEIDGHCFNAIDGAFNEAISYKKGPTAIIALTHLGHGVSIIENDCRYHGKALTLDQAHQAHQQIDQYYQRINK